MKFTGIVLLTIARAAIFIAGLAQVLSLLTLLISFSEPSPAPINPGQLFVFVAVKVAILVACFFSFRWLGQVVNRVDGDQLGASSALTRAKSFLAKTRSHMDGWKRLVIVVSLIWILGVAVFAYRDLGTLQDEQKRRIMHYDKPVATYVFSAAQPESEITDLLNTSLIPLVAENHDKYMGRVIYDYYEYYVSRHKKRLISNYTQLAIIPVVVLILLALSASWVKSGFALGRRA